MRLIFPGQYGYERVTADDIQVSWMACEQGDDPTHARLDMLVVGRVERFFSTGRDGPTYGSAFNRRVGGSMHNDRYAEFSVARRAGVLLVDHFAGATAPWRTRPSLGPLRRLALRRLLGRLDPDAFGRRQYPIRSVWWKWKLNSRWSPWRIRRG